MRLAIVDDHEMVREGLAALLLADASRDGAGDVTLVYVGADPRAVIDVRPDVVLLDIDLGPAMPSITEFLPPIVAVGTHVLLISAFEEAPAIRRALRAGALGFVPKRVSSAELVEALQTVARGELYMSVDLANILANAPEAPGLSPRELDALRLYASGLKLAAVASRMGISPHTAKEYLDRVRAKYENVGRSARTRTQLFAEAQRDGFLTGV
jgi:DNA-binding NarL/FixJ family response regulator